ncbi:hypothetical protein [Planosporangium mesophilum]|uniref:Tetratricopeptide repeat protein n=1 Tax=Planosporangium mesophilum TaxID=689768 RepID=A0A8J3T9D1_9ACTN|nr:hypothetical protein [Planosporangium mesophilum]NJC84040.1 hypothetical protein [Planosporangium mesophilum]GII22960.1 hypothetical protein Pme01_25570 [Planosporangium mesophilum]
MSEPGGLPGQEWETRVTDRTERARLLAASGRPAAALILQEEALAIVRDLAAEYPDDLRVTRMLADALYATGSSLTAIGRPDVAVAVLDEGARTYQELGRRGATVRRPLADVHAAKGAAELARGHGASAVLELDSAVNTYLALRALTDDNPADDNDGDTDPLDLARVLALNASALRAHGDPDLAVASAGAALRLYASHAPASPAHTTYLLLAASTASDLHGAHGRLESALEADDVAVRAARAAAEAGGRLGRTAGTGAAGDRAAGDRAAGDGAAGDGAAGDDGAADDPVDRDRVTRELATALTRKGVHLRAVGRGAEGDSFVAQGRAADAAASDLVTQEWEAGTRPVTLAGSLETAVRVLGPGRVPDTLVESLVGSAASRELLAPSGRCGPQGSPGYAATLADIANQLLPVAPAEGVRIGLEAHYLFAVASRAQTMPMRHAYAEFGFRWALVLLACSRHYAADDLPMALDLAGWADVAAMGLVPFLAGSPGMTALVRECLVHHADLYARNGETEAGAEVLRVVRSLDEYA